MANYKDNPTRFTALQFIGVAESDPDNFESSNEDIAALYWNSATKTLRFFNGTVWSDFGGGSGGGITDIDPGTGISINKDNPLIPIISAIPQSTAGIFRLTYFTGDVETTALGNFYLATPLDDGTESSVTQSVSVNDGQTAWYGQDLLGAIANEDSLVQAGDYSGELAIHLNGVSGSRFDFTIEVYVANESGDVISSGIGDEPIGDLGVRPLARLKTGATDLPTNDEVNRTFVGSVKEAYTQLAGTRGRYHIACTKVDGDGGIEDVDIFFGTDHSGFISVPVALNTDNVLNNSTVEGATTTDALDALKGDIEGFVPYTGATEDVDLGARGLTATDVTVEGDLAITDVEISEEVVFALFDDIVSSDEKLNTGNITNENGAIFTFITGGINAVSDGTATIVTRPQILWGSLAVGKQYRITINPTINSGSTTLRLYDGSTYIEQDSLIQPYDITFTCQGANCFFSVDGRETFDIDFQISLKEIITGTNVIKKRELGSAAFKNSGDFVENREIGNVPHVVTDYSTIEGLVVEADTQVSDGTQISISNKTTSDYPFITAIGEPEFNTGDFPSSDIATATIVSGQSFVTSKPIGISAAKFYTDVVTENSVFTGYLRIYTTTPEDEDAQIYSFTGLPLVAGTPFELPISPKLALAGQTIEVFIIARENTSTTDIDVPYIWAGNTTDKPVDGEINTNASNNVLRMSLVDKNAVDISATINSLVAGSYVKVSKGGSFFLYEITNVRTQIGNRKDFDAQFLGQNGTIIVGDGVTATCQVPISLSASYSYQSAYWAANPVDWASSTEGVLLFDGVAQTGVSDNAYGADIKAREVTKSDDWDIILLPTVVASSTGGETETPNLQQVTDVGASTNKSISVGDAVVLGRNINSLLNDYPGTSYAGFFRNEQTNEADYYTFGIYANAKYTGATNQTLLYGADVITKLEGSAGCTFLYGQLNRIYLTETTSATNAVGIYSRVYHQSAGSVDKLSAGFFDLANENGGNVDFADLIRVDLSNLVGGTIGILNALSIKEFVNNGTITESRAIYIDNTVDVGVTSYAILSESVSRSKFAGNIEINSPNGVARIDVINETNFYQTYMLWDRFQIYSPQETDTRFFYNEIEYEDSGTTFKNRLIFGFAPSQDNVWTMPDYSGDIPTKDDIKVDETTPDAYVGKRLKPKDPTANGFFNLSNVDQRTGFESYNTSNTENATSSIVVGTGGLYDNLISIQRFPANYGLGNNLSGKGVIYSSENGLELLSNADGDINIRIGATFGDIINTDLPLKVTIKANNEIILPQLTTAIIDAESTGRIPTTKEWVEAQVRTPKTIVNTGTVIELDNIAMNYCNMASANSSTTYTLTNVVLGGVSRVLINASTEPVITGATKLDSPDFEANTDMYMHVENNGNRTEFFFTKI